MIKVYAKGVFDILHYGHINFFKLAKGLGDWLTVGVTPDERVISMKRQPLFDGQERAIVVESIRYVDQVLLDGPREITLDFMREHNFDLYVFGSKNHDEREVRLYDCRDLPSDMILEIPYTHGVSTTEIINTSKKY
ncbi:adenylyltransferase/cytidyltransferase family protein [Candidatus Methylopumilus turicensis]|uniref:ethanolamine-phosphate cytidylyltransferase n=1 Tax=Candidatus Methylopumilus turicensis TaxID=1581680 RepID=A0A0B7J0D3_9PROT